MTEQFILDYIPQRMEQLGYKRYHVRYRDLTLKPMAKVFMAAYNELFFIVGDPPGGIHRVGVWHLRYCGFRHRRKYASTPRGDCY